MFVFCFFIFQYVQLRDEGAPVTDSLEKIQEIISSLNVNNLDSISISDTISLLKTRHNRSLNLINDNINAFGKALEKFRNNEQRFADTLALIKKIEENLTELNRPVGRNPEDVYEIMTSYQVQN